MLRLFLFGTFTIMTSGFLFPIQAGAQGWEVQVAWVNIDHDYATSLDMDLHPGEQIPGGVGISARRSIFSPSLFLDLEFTKGSEERDGVICGGYVMPGDCISERVDYSGGIVLVSLGGLLQQSISEPWSIGIRPEVGFGSLRIREDGTETGEVYKENQAVASAGIGAEVGFRVGGGHGFQLLGIATWNYLKPIGVDIDPDARKALRDPLPQYSVGVGVRWE